jgi:hypothetical protein
MWSFRKLRRLPVELRVALLATCFVLWLNLIWAAAQASWKIDPGTATLCGAIIGFAIIGQQARRGFTNLMKSQRNQAELDREAREHTAKLDREFELDKRNNAREVLLAAMWAEACVLWNAVSEAEVNATTFAMVHENFKKERVPNTSRGMVLPGFDAPVFKANISQLGLLGPSLAADVVTVMARAEGKDRPAIDIIPSNEILITIYRGNAEALKKWRQDLAHVAQRISAAMSSQTDPGTLASTEARRRKQI